MDLWTIQHVEHVMWIMMRERIVELIQLESVGRRPNDWRGMEMLDVVGVESVPSRDAIIRNGDNIQD